MPAIVPQHQYETWLAAPASEAERLADLLVPFEASLMKRHPVSPLVNKPENDSPECTKEVARFEERTLELWG
jgi:putative SOS response-associated peptidase YedK